MLTRVFQTTGRGNPRDALYRIDFDKTVFHDVCLEQIAVFLDAGSAKNIDSLQIYLTHTAEYYADPSPLLLGKTKVKKGSNVIKCHDKRALDDNSFLWITCRVSDEAAIGETINAQPLHIIIYNKEKKHKIDLTSTAATQNSEGMKIFKRQQFLFVPTTAGCRFYRIPSMILNDKGDLLVAADRRYDSSADLGEHKIDVAVRRSSDNGKTWSPQQIIATGDSVSDEAFGYGDAALVKTKTGKLICLLSAGKNNFFRGMRHIGISTSDDDGLTWTVPRELTASRFTDEVHSLSDSLGFWSIFPTSDKGLCLPDGRILFAANCIGQTDTYTVDCYMLYSDDEGRSWTIGKECAYRGGDESKLERMNDGSLLLSVRQDGYRGFNTSRDNGTTWGKQWQTTDLWGNACNADMLYYSRDSEGEQDIMLHTLINDKDRKNLTLYRSLDKGQTWHELINIQRGGAAYSSMVKLNNGDVAIFYEDDSYSSGNGYHLNFLIIDKSQIVQ